MPPQTVKIGLALGSGGWRGLAHIGVIKSLLKHNFTISAIAGASAGALVGGLYALWQDIDRVEAAFNKLKPQDLLFAFSDPSLKRGLFSGNHALKLFEKYFSTTNIEDLSLPLKLIASDLVSGTSVILDSGSLAFAVRASSSIPFLFDPVPFGNKLLVDGGLTNPVPADVVRSMGVDVVIGVNIYDSIFPLTQPQTKISRVNLISLSTKLILNQLSIRDSHQADVTVTPKLANADSDLFTRFLNNQETIDQGEIAMDQSIPDLLNRQNHQK